jgi:hypothetical protein
MADLMQLDKAAALVGKSEVTLRRLIKAGKIPFQKEKTLTGFIYRVDPENVRAYYHGRGGAADDGIPAGHAGDEPERPTPSYMPKSADPVRIAIEDEGGHAAEYWQKRSDLYEDRYHQELQKHAQTREELGMWRGRAEQAQSMIIKMLPPAETPAIPTGDPSKAEAATAMSPLNMALWIVAAVVILGAGGLTIYLRYFSLH